MITRPKTFGFLDESCILLEWHAASLTTCRALSLCRGVQIGALGFKHFYLYLSAKYRINQFSFKLIFQPASDAILINVCDFFECVEGTNYPELAGPGRETIHFSCAGVEYFLSQWDKLCHSFDSASNTLSFKYTVGIERPEVLIAGANGYIFWPLWLTKQFSPSVCHIKRSNTIWTASPRASTGFC